VREDAARGDIAYHRQYCGGNNLRGEIPEVHKFHEGVEQSEVGDKEGGYHHHVARRLPADVLGVLVLERPVFLKQEVGRPVDQRSDDC